MPTMPSHLVVLLAALIGLTVTVPASAQWKWRDKAGQTQYSDLPPPVGVADQDILQRPIAGQRKPVLAAASTASAAASSAPLLAPKASEPELEAKRKKNELDEAAKKKAEEARLVAARADACTRAQANLRTFDSGVRIARTDAKGEREYLDDSTRAAETQRTREIIATQCK